MPQRVDKERLIALVRERPVIWDPNVEAYHNPNLKESAWTEIAKEMNVEQWERAATTERSEMLADLQKKWRHLHDQFHKEMLKKDCKRDTSEKSTTDNLKNEDPQQEEEQDSLSGYDSSTGTSSVSTPEPAKGGKKRLGPSTQPETQQANARKAVGCAPKRARVAPPVSLEIDARGVEFQSTRRSEGWPEAFGQVVTEHCRDLLAHFRFPLQNAILTLFEACTPPNSPSTCFQALDRWRVSRYTDASVPGQSTYPPPTDHHPYSRRMPVYYTPDQYLGAYHRGDQYQAPPRPPYQTLSTPQQPQPASLPCQTYPAVQQR